MRANRTETIWLKPNKDLRRLCHISKNLYNEANYIIRQEFIDNGKWIRYGQLCSLLKNSENYKLLPAQTAQQILKLLDSNWKSFFNSMKKWKRNKKRFLGRPKLPKYKKKDGYFMLIFTNQQCNIRERSLRFPKKVNLEVKTRLGDDTNLKQVRIIPKGIGYVCEVIYRREVQDKNLNKQNIVGIDLGIRNVITMVDNIGNLPIVIKGGIIKSMNQYYNKKKAYLQSINLKKVTKKMHRLNNKRSKKLNDYFHKTSRFIINYCISNNIGTIVIGYNELWKQKIRLGRKTNQSFVHISYHKLIKQIEYKAEEIGIDTVRQEESHTSKCSFLDNEPIEHRNNYVGKRVKRGLFRSKKGIIINADVNAGYNIIRKAFSKAFGQLDADGIEGVALHPIRINYPYKQFLTDNAVNK